MNNDNITLDKNLLESSASLFAITLSILSTTSKYRRSKTILPEILYIIPPEILINFIKVYGGEVIRVPTTKEVEKDLIVAIVAYYRFIEKRSWKDIIKLTNIKNIRAISKRINIWMNNLTDQEKELFLIINKESDSWKRKKI